MDKQKVAPTPHNCPNLGLKGDRHSVLAYASSGNHCFHCQSPTTPSLEHQVTYCLSPRYMECPVQARSASEAFPKELRYAHKRHSFARSPGGWVFPLAAVGILSVGWVLWQGILTVRSSPAPDTAGFSSPTSLPSPSDTPGPSETPAPVLVTTKPALTATRTPVSVRALEVPFKVDGRKFILHRVLDGEQLVLLARNFDTSIEVIQSLNYQLPETVWTNSVLIFAPGMLTVDPDLPAFTAYEVFADTTLEALADALDVDLPLLEHFNLCSGNCPLSAGDWIVIPHPR
jgi:hypothetical protein